MTALSRLDRTRTILIVVLVTMALLWALALSSTVLALLGVVDLTFGTPLAIRRVVLSIAPVIALAGAGYIVWRNRGVRSRGSVALWLENRVPAMRYALVTLVDRPDEAPTANLERVVAQAEWDRPIRLAVLRKARLPVLLGLIAAGLLLLLPAATLRRVTTPRVGDILDRPSANNAVGPFSPLVVTVVPPAYSRLDRQVLENPEAVTGLVGSTLDIRGRGWSQRLTMPDTAAPLWLSRDGQRRLLILMPQPDSVPVVRLIAPVNDTVRRDPNGAVALRAEARDDFGLGQGWFEYIVSSGEGENYVFRSGIIGRRSLENSRVAELGSALRLDSLGLAPGNIVHLRAAARDGNTMTGSGTGYSETRTIRIPRPDEGDSVSVDQVGPAAGDSSLLSQRMLIQMAEALERQRTRIPRDTLVSESRRIAQDQATLRRRVADIVFLRLGGEASMEDSDSAGADILTPEGLLEAAQQATAINGEPTDFSEDETPVVALNRPLLEAYNAMWAAGRELDIGAPGRALPHMREALEAILRARQAERIYLRGRPTVRPVDLGRIRLAGKRDDANPAPARGTPQDPRLPDALITRFARAVELLPQQSGVDSLQLLRIDALEYQPGFAATLGEAIAALRSGSEATATLIRARRILAGPTRVVAGLRAWDAAP